MSALAADRITQTKLPGLQSYPVAAATKIYAGSMVAINGADGFAVPAADTDLFLVQGIALATVDNSGGADGDKRVQVFAPVIARLKGATLEQNDVGKVVYVIDDETVDETAGTNSVKAGVLVEYISASEGWVLIHPGKAGFVTPP
jgi:hypothetical protein